jgi:hypothetical protein
MLFTHTCRKVIQYIVPERLLRKCKVCVGTRFVLNWSTKTKVVVSNLGKQPVMPFHSLLLPI